MSRFRPTIGAVDTSNFSQTADISQRGRNASYDRDVETRKAVADIVATRNALRLQRAETESQDNARFIEANIQIEQLKQQASQAAAELALKMKGLKTEILINRERNQTTAGIAGLEAQSRASLLDKELGFKGEQAGLDRAATVNLQDKELTAKRAEGAESRALDVDLAQFRERGESRRFSERVGLERETLKTQVEQTDKEIASRERIAQMETAAMLLKQKNPELSEAFAMSAGKVISDGYDEKTASDLLLAASTSVEKKEAERVILGTFISHVEELIKPGRIGSLLVPDDEKRQTFTKRNKKLEQELKDPKSPFNKSLTNMERKNLEVLLGKRNSLGEAKVYENAVSLINDFVSSRIIEE